MSEVPSYLTLPKRYPYVCSSDHNNGTGFNYFNHPVNPRVVPTNRVQDNRRETELNYPPVPNINRRPYNRNPSSDLYYTSPADLYKLECARRLEAEELAYRRRQLESLILERNKQMYPSYGQFIPPESVNDYNGGVPSMMHLYNNGVPKKSKPESSRHRVKDAPYCLPVRPVDLSHANRFMCGSSPYITELSSSPCLTSYSQPSLNFNCSPTSSHSNISFQPGRSPNSSDASTSSPIGVAPMPPLTRCDDCDSGSDGEIVIDVDVDDTAVNLRSTHADKKTKTPNRCTICGEDAICKSYGAICCDSCRLFFRRTIVKRAHKMFKCAGNKDCIVTGRHRSRCQYCRFQRCLKNGMKATFVLKSADEDDVVSSEGLLEKPESPPSSPQIDVCKLTVEKYADNLSNNEAFEVHGIVLVYEKMREQMTPPPQSEVPHVLNVFKGILSSFLQNNLFGNKKEVEVDTKLISSLRTDSLVGALLLRLAYYYDPVVHGLPHCILLSPSNANGMVKKAQKIPPQLYADILHILKTLHGLKVDNTVICLLIMLYLSQTDNYFDYHVNNVDDVVDRFSVLLKKYISSIYGPSKACDLFPRLLMKLVDIRELQVRLEKYVFI
ncbi:Uncharacterised protein g6103 [Pycnogonum litorale]